MSSGIGLIPVLALAAAVPLTAQQIVVETASSETGEPIAGALISFEGNQGARTTVAGLTDSRGRLLVRLPSTGTYRVTAEMIGRQTTRSDAVAVGQGDVVSLRIPMAVHAIALDAVTVEASRSCRLRPAEGEALADLWDEARKALTVTQWSEGSGVYRFTIRNHERLLDPGGRRVRSEQTRVSRGIAASPIRSLPPETLAERGFIVEDRLGGYQYFAPDASVLLSDVFLDSHCLGLVPGDPSSGLIGLTFTPSTPGPISDIEGTLWLDGSTSALQSLDFTYTRPPWTEVRGLAGGRVEFERLPSGAWVVREWHIRMPEVALDPTLARGADSGIRLSAIREVGARVIRVTTLDRQTVADAPDGSARGVVWDSIRNEPLVGATVLFDGTPYRTHTDSTGSFSLLDVPEGRFAVRYEHPRLEELGYDPPPVDVEVRRGAETSVGLGIPRSADPLEAVLSVLGKTATPETGASTVWGTVTDHATGQPLDGVLVRVPGLERQAVTDSLGAFRLDEVPSGTHQVAFSMLGYADRVGRVTASEGQHIELGVEMTTQAIELEPMVVSTERRIRKLEINGFYQRRQTGLGQFLSVEEIEESAPSRTTSLFSAFRGVRYMNHEIAQGLYEEVVVFDRGQGVSGRSLSTRSICYPSVWVDDVQVSAGGDEPAVLNRLVTARQIVGVEAYPSTAHLPIRYSGAGRSCGVILIWTRG